MKAKFLATTALEEFWDTSQEMVFLSDACCRYSRRAFWEPLKGEHLPCLWKDRHQFDDAYSYVSCVYESLLPYLGEALNAVHDTKHGTRYWRILLGTWLYSYICAVYNSYQHIRLALNLYPGITTIAMSAQSFISPKDSAHYKQLIVDDPYNLQISSKLASLMGMHFSERTYRYDENGVLPAIFHPGSKKLRGLIKSAFNGICRECGNSNSVVLMNPYFRYTEQIKIFLKSRGKIRIFHKEKPVLSDKTINAEMRSELAKIAFGGDEFKSILIKLIAFDMPQSFIENYGLLEDISRSEYPTPGKAIGSAILWHFHDDFKHWAAKSAELGTVLVGIQHGGNYGVAANVPVADHELAITDFFCSWGWESKNVHAKVLPLPSALLSGRKPIGASNKKQGVLLTLTATSRYLLWLQNLHNGEYEDYMRWQMRFTDALFPVIKKNLILRFRSDDTGRDLKERWKDLGYQEAQMDNWEDTFYLSLKKYRLFVCGDLSTTYAEALAADMPTILFWNPKVFVLKPEAESCFRELSRVGVLFDNPEAAAKAANMVYNDVETWWNAPERQNARRMFCTRFAKTSKDALGEWISKLVSINAAK